MSILDGIKQKAKADVRHIVLAEGEDERVVRAAAQIASEGLARITLLGQVDALLSSAKKLGISLDSVTLVDPATSDKAAAYADKLYELRKNKG
nr:phosphate acyltransferase [bacterium]